MDVLGEDCVVEVMPMEFMIAHVSPPRSYLTKSATFTMTQSPPLYLTRSGDEMIGF